MRDNKEIILELEEKKKELSRQHTIDMRTLDEAIVLLKKQYMQYGSTHEEKKKLGRKPSEVLIQLKADIYNLITNKQEGVNKKVIMSSLSNSNYKLSKMDFEKLASKATSRLSDDGKLVCIGGTSGAFWYLPEWIENGKVKSGFEPNKNN